MPQRDVTLVRQAQAGDPEAFAVLVERYGPLVRGLVLEVARQHDEADDLSQEVFTRAYQQLASLRKPGKFASWLGQIASRVAVDWLRHQRAEAHAVRASNDRLLRVHLPSQDVALEAREAVDLLWDALDRLTPEYRRVAVLFYLEGCAQADISRFLGISGATVRWRLARARRGLEEGLIELLSREAAQRPRSTRQLRDKILSGMPLVAFSGRRHPPAGWPGGGSGDWRPWGAPASWAWPGWSFRSIRTWQRERSKNEPEKWAGFACGGKKWTCPSCPWPGRPDARSRASGCGWRWPVWT